MTKTLKFSALENGAVFKSAGRPNGDTFRKEYGRPLARCDKCGSGSGNAINEDGEYTVHFCPDADILVEVVEPDVSVANHGSIFMIQPITQAAKEWVDENVPLEDYQWLGSSFSCEHRYVEDLVAGMQGDGLVVA
jgi:hypothetical protein